VWLEEIQQGRGAARHEAPPGQSAEAPT